jgi:hypothetical protein
MPIEIAAVEGYSVVEVGMAHFTPQARCCLITAAVLSLLFHIIYSHGVCGMITQLKFLWYYAFTIQRCDMLGLSYIMMDRFPILQIDPLLLLIYSTHWSLPFIAT